MKLVVLCLLVSTVCGDVDIRIRDVVSKLLEDVHVNVSFAEIHKDLLAYKAKAIKLVQDDQKMYGKVDKIIESIDNGYLALEGEDNPYGENLRQVQQHIQSLRDALATKFDDEQRRLFDGSIEIIRGLLRIPSTKDTIQKMIELAKYTEIFEVIMIPEVYIRRSFVLEAKEAFTRAKSNPSKLFKKLYEVDLLKLDIKHPLSTSLRHVIEDYEAIYNLYEQKTPNDELLEITDFLKKAKAHQTSHLLDNMTNIVAEETFESIVDDLIDLKNLIKK